MKEFAIPPWEHVGASFDPQCHAQTRLEIGGKKRTLLLKMRQGIIYFKEPTLASIYAIPKIFDQSLAQDPQTLIEVWTREVQQENYGRLLVSHRKWPKIPTEASFCVIMRANASAWIAEHFDTQWKEYTSPLKISLPLWSSKGSYFIFTDDVVKAKGAEFLHRVIDPTRLETVPTSWTHGTAQEFIDVVCAAFQLFAVPYPELFGRERFPGVPHPCTCKSNSSFQEGSVVSDLIYAGQDFPQFRRVWGLIKSHCGFVGVQWRKASDHAELQAQFDPKVWEQGIAQWGENWRGNWVGSGTSLKLTFPPLSAPSHHEKLEAALTVRDFLRDKMPPEKLETLLKGTLNG